jgi:phosphatidylserine/phosphatidylglycerophosphate/cardiolipin synthase-like enzyme
MPILAGLLFLLLPGCEPEPSIPKGVRVYFSPPGGATEAIETALGRATNTVLVQAYSFTSARISRALLDAHRRGVRVQVILDDSHLTERYSEADFLRNNGIPVLLDAQHAIAHNKVMVIDEVVVITGSFNFTRAAEEKNAENLLVIHDPVLARQYSENWLAHQAHSVPYGGERSSSRPPRKEKRD